MMAEDYPFDFVRSFAMGPVLTYAIECIPPSFVPVAETVLFLW
jgi:hypothetical protein